MMDRMLRAFEMWDVDGNGFIDADDIRAACEGLYVFLTVASPGVFRGAHIF